MSSLRNAVRRGNRGDRRLGPGIFGNMPSRSGRRATAPSPTRAGRPRRRAMRISEHILSVALFGFGYFRTLADSHADETPGTRPAVFVAKAFVAIGGYYLAGIPNSEVKPDAVHAREMFWYAASYFGDSDAQYRLGRMYLDGQGTAKDPKQARRWLFTAAREGPYEAQAVLRAMLVPGPSGPRHAAPGLTRLLLAS